LACSSRSESRGSSPRGDERTMNRSQNGSATQARSPRISTCRPAVSRHLRVGTDIGLLPRPRVDDLRPPPRITSAASPTHSQAGVRPQLWAPVQLRRGASGHEFVTVFLGDKRGEQSLRVRRSRAMDGSASVCVSAACRHCRAFHTLHLLRATAFAPTLDRRGRGDGERSPARRPTRSGRAGGMAGLNRPQRRRGGRGRPPLRGRGTQLPHRCGAGPRRSLQPSRRTARRPQTRGDSRRSAT